MKRPKDEEVQPVWFEKLYDSIKARDSVKDSIRRLIECYLRKWEAGR